MASMAVSFSPPTPFAFAAAASSSLLRLSHPCWFPHPPPTSSEIISHHSPPPPFSPLMYSSRRTLLFHVLRPPEINSYSPPPSPPQRTMKIAAADRPPPRPSNPSHSPRPPGDVKLSDGRPDRRFIWEFTNPAATVKIRQPDLFIAKNVVVHGIDNILNPSLFHVLRPPELYVGTIVRSFTYMRSCCAYLLERDKFHALRPPELYVGTIVTMIDLPGITRVPVDGQSAEICEQISEIVMEHITLNVLPISNKPLTPVVKKRGVPDLIMIDLTGITRVPVDGQPADICEQISEIVLGKKHIRVLALV